MQQREVAKQKLAQFKREKLQQLSEAKLKVEVVLAEQKKRVVEAEQEVVEKTTKAEEKQSVAVTLAEQKLKVAQTQLEAPKTRHRRSWPRPRPMPTSIKFDNAAEAAGLAAQVSAFDGDGAAMARNMLLAKIAPSFRTILGNSEGPLMELFSQFTRGTEKRGRALKPASRSEALPTVIPPPARARTGRPRSRQPRQRSRTGPASRLPARPEHRSTRPRRSNHEFLCSTVVWNRVPRPPWQSSAWGSVGYFGIWQWMFCRIEVPPGHSLLVRYKGPWPFGGGTQAPEGTLVKTSAARRSAADRHS